MELRTTTKNITSTMTITDIATFDCGAHVLYWQFPIKTSPQPSCSRPMDGRGPTFTLDNFKRGWAQGCCVRHECVFFFAGYLAFVVVKENTQGHLLKRHTNIDLWANSSHFQASFFQRPATCLQASAKKDPCKWRQKQA